MKKQIHLIFGINPLLLGIILFIAVRLLIWVYFDFPALFLTGDDKYYVDVANNLFNLGAHFESKAGYNSYRAPAYPFFLATLLQLNIEINSLNIALLLLFFEPDKLETNKPIPIEIQSNKKFAK